MALFCIWACSQKLTISELCDDNVSTIVKKWHASVRIHIAVCTIFVISFFFCKQRNVLLQTSVLSLFFPGNSQENENLFCSQMEDFSTPLHNAYMLFFFKIFRHKTKQILLTCNQPNSPDIIIHYLIVNLLQL